jgi:hypothetical protein
MGRSIDPFGNLGKELTLPIATRPLVGSQEQFDQDVRHRFRVSAQFFDLLIRQTVRVRPEQCATAFCRY